METRTSPRDYWRLLASYLKPQRGKVLLLAALVLTSIGLQLASPLILRRFIDDALDGEPLRTLLLIASVYIGFAILIQVIRLGETWTSEYVGWTATNDMRADLAQHVLNLDMEFHNRHSPGALIERVDGDIFMLGNFFSKFILNVLGNVLLAVGVIILLFRIDWQIGLVVALFGITLVAVMLGFGRFVAVRFVRSRQAYADLMGFLEERISGTEDIRSAGANAYIMRRNDEQHQEVYATSDKSYRLSAILNGSSQLLGVLGMVAALAIGAARFKEGAITVGTVFVIFQYTQLITHPLEEIARQLRDFQQAAAAIQRIRALQSERPTILDTGTTPLPAGSLAVDLDHITFAYSDGDGEPTLRDVAVQLGPERVLGVVGRTGSGKSTITKLLVRFVDPTEGAIRLGGVDLRDVPLENLRKRVALVTQEVQLFRASVRQNLTLFDHTIPDERVIASLHQLGLGGWYDGLEEGLDTMLSSGGGGISAGEAQILAMARVFLRDPDVVILDEASSRLDPVTEARLEQAIDTLLAGRTAIIIAHRLATIERADEVLVMADGRVAEHGNRATLAANPDSRFAALLRAGHDLVPTAEVTP
jgi:ATP-binding cassette subfamily B protein